MNVKRTLTAFTVLLVGMLALYALIFYPDYQEPRYGRFIVITVALSALWIGALALFKRLSSARSLQTYLIIGLVAGALFRVVALTGAGETAYLSDDVYRYVWDGRLIAHGVNPFAYAPDDPAVYQYAEENILPRINHTELPTIYPPVSQAFFLAAYLVDSDSIYGFKLISALFDLLTLLALFKLLRVNKLPPALALIYWLAPLTVIEFYLSAHHDILVLPFFIMTLVYFAKGKPALCGIFLALAIMAKYNVALISLPLLLGFAGRERRIFVLSGLAVAAAAYLPFLIYLKPAALFGSLLDYTIRWQYNGSLYHILRLLTSPKISKIIIAPVLIGTLLYLGITIKDRIKGVCASLAAYLALTPTLFPWYLILALPLMTVRRSSAMFALLSMIFLSYWGLIGLAETGLWVEHWSLRVVEYAPFYLALLFSFRWKLFEPRKADSFAL